MDSYKTHVIILILSLAGTVVLGIAAKSTLALDTRLKFGLLIIQIALILYLLYKLLTSALSAWESWRWAPDKLR